MRATSAAAASSSFSKENSYLDLPVRKFQQDGVFDYYGKIIQEVEVNIFVDGDYVHTLTCSPWNIEELAVGYLFFKEVIRSTADIQSVQLDAEQGLLEVSLAQRPMSLGFENVIPLSFVSSNVQQKRPHYRDAHGLSLVTSTLTLSADEVNALAEKLESDSLLFRKTGGTHSALLVKENSVVAWLEDIGRHSAVDKLAGWCLLNQVATDQSVLVFSGRVPYEIIVKTIRLGCPVIISPGAPTNLSIELAQRHGVTLIGFAKKGQFNVYSHPERVQGS